MCRYETSRPPLALGRCSCTCLWSMLTFRLLSSDSRPSSLPLLHLINTKTSQFENILARQFGNFLARQFQDQRERLTTRLMVTRSLPPSLSTNSPTRSTYNDGPIRALAIAWPSQHPMTKESVDTVLWGSSAIHDTNVPL
jgi:hypothetical protein